jgi:hypothetical protein
MVMRKSLIIVWSLFVLMSLTVSLASAYTVTSGVDATAVMLGGDRFRSFGNTGGNENYVGVPDLGVAANRAEIGYNWVASNYSSIFFQYDKLNDKLISKVDLDHDGSYDKMKEYTGLSAKITSLGRNASLLTSINYFQITLADRDLNTQVDFKNVILNGTSVSDFIGNNALATYTVKGFNFSNGFILTGDIYLSGIFSTTSQENSRVEAGFGHVNVVPVPGAVWLRGSGLLGLVGLKRKMGA